MHATTSQHARHNKSTPVDTVQCAIHGSSAATTHKDTSETPRSFGLAHPLNNDDMKHMETDVERNLKWYSIVEALRSGRLPSNAQLDVMLGRVIERCPNPSRRQAKEWSADTLTTLAQFRKFLETMRVVVQEKNQDELFQDTLWLMFVESFSNVTGFQLHHNGDRQGAADKDAPGDESPGDSLHAIDQDLYDLVDTTAVESDGREGELAYGARHIRTLATIFLTNSDLRHAIRDLIAVGRKLIRSKTPKNQAEAEVVAETAATATPSDLGPAPAAPQFTTLSEHENDEGIPHIPGAWGPDWDHSDSDSDSDSGGEDLWEVPEESPVAMALKNNPRAQDFIRNFKAAVTSIQARPGYGESMAWLIDVFETYEREMFAAKFPNKPGSTAEPIVNSLEATRHILNNIILLLQRFSRGKTVSPVQRAIHKLYEDILVTPQLRELWTDIDSYVRQILLEDGYIHTQGCATEGRLLFERAEVWLNNTVYWAHWNAILSGLEIWLGSNPAAVDEVNPDGSAGVWFHGDPLTIRMEKDWSSLVSSLFLDSRKHFHIKSGLWKDLAGILFPSVRGFGYVTFPRIEFVSPSMELVLENVNVSFANLLPTYVNLEWHDFVKYSPFPEVKEACSTGTHSRIRLRATQIQGEVRDAMISFKWKKGVTVHDMALADIILSRQGISLDLELEVNTHDDSPFIIRAKKINFSMDEVTLVPHKTKSGHDNLYRFVLSAAVVPWLKRKLAAILARKLDQKIELLNVELMALRTHWTKVSKKAERDVRRGLSAPGATARFLQVAQERLKVWTAKKTVRDVATRREIRRFRRLSAASDISNRSGVSDSSAADPLPEPRGAKPKAFKKFRVSSRLKDTLLPHVSYDKTKSLVWRRRRIEDSARRTDEAVAAIKTAAKTVSVKATGFSSNNTSKPWRSPVFNFA